MNASTLAANVIRRSYQPRSKLTGSQWMNRYGWIARSSGASEHGEYSTARAPYLAEMADVFCDETHPDVAVNKPAQVGYTELLIQYCAYVFKEDPSGHLLVQPSIEAAKAWMKERIDPMLAESPHMHGVIRSEGGRRTSDDTMQRKVYRGGWTVALGANSPTGLRGRPTRRLSGDERSGWTLDARQQGDPWGLGEERTNTFWNAKRIQGSTPGEEGVCPTTEVLRKSDWREFHVACPACGFREPFRWKSSDGSYRLVCDRDPADQLIPQTARYLCVGCGVLIPESEKPRMLRGGIWVPRHPGREIVGFDIGPAIISPWLGWPAIIKKWLEAKDNLEKLKVFVTHTLAETWKNPGERIDAQSLLEREAPSELPAWVGALFAAVDVQKNRLEYLILGVGAGEEAIVLEWSHVEGDPTQTETWDEVLEILQQNRDARLLGVAIDTGYLTDEAWKAVDAWRGEGIGRVIGIKGEDGKGRPWIQQPGKQKLKSARRPWLIGTETAKDALQLRLQKEVPPGGPMAIHFADSLDPVFFDQLTAEERKTVIVKGRQQKAWRPKSAGLANEGLDLTVYAFGALYQFGPRFLPQLGRLAAQRAAAKQQPDAVPAPIQAPTGELATPPRRTKGGFATMGGQFGGRR